MLKALHLEVERGEFLCLYGKSGCGKSTLLNILGLIDEPSEGEYFLEGTEVGGLSAAKKAGIRNTYMGYAGIGKKERKKRSAELRKRFSMEARAGCYPAQLSGGEKQRVAIAQALANGPQIILADEPTGSVDSGNSIAIMEELKRLNEEGITVIMVTHDRTLAHYASRILEMKDGVIGSKIH